MAIRPVFVPSDQKPFVKEVNITFEWFPGFALTQAQKSIVSLHNAARKHNIDSILEISSKSRSILGIQLSAFNLGLEILDGTKTTVECAFQGSKVFEHGGPFPELFHVSSKNAKKDERLTSSGELIGFMFMGEEFPIKPLTAFYDWLYIIALKQNNHLSGKLHAYQGFTDIAFNPKKSYSCQARSAALFVGLSKNNLIDKVDWDKTDYLSIFSTGDQSNKSSNQADRQLNLPL